MTEVRDFKVTLSGLGERRAESACFGYIAFTAQFAFADDRIFHPLHILSVLAMDTLNHLVGDSHTSSLLLMIIFVNLVVVVA